MREPAVGTDAGIEQLTNFPRPTLLIKCECGEDALSTEYLSTDGEGRDLLAVTGCTACGSLSNARLRGVKIEGGHLLTDGVEYVPHPTMGEEVAGRSLPEIEIICDCESRTLQPLPTADGEWIPNYRCRSCEGVIRVRYSLASLNGAEPLTPQFDRRGLANGGSNCS